MVSAGKTPLSCLGTTSHWEHAAKAASSALSASRSLRLHVDQQTENALGSCPSLIDWRNAHR